MEHTSSVDQHKRWVNTAAVAEFTGYSEVTLARLRVTGGGPPFSKRGRGKQAQVRYSLEDVDTWMRSHLRLSTSDSGVGE